MLKRRTKRKLSWTVFILTMLFVILITGAEAGRWGRGWNPCDVVFWC